MTDDIEFNEETCPHTFGELVFTWRDRYSRRYGTLSQQKLGDQIVVGKNADGTDKTVGKNLISLWETGQVLPPVAATGQIIDAIIEALRCTPEEKRMLARAYICDIAKEASIERM